MSQVRILYGLPKTQQRRHRFPRKYTLAGIALHARTNGLHDYLSGPAAKKIMEGEWAVYGHLEFGNISRISVAHLYNLRRSFLYRDMTKRYTKTKPAVVKIGERKRLNPGGNPVILELTLFTSFFPVSVVDRKGKVKKTYPCDEAMTPYDKLKSLPEAEGYLQPGVTLQ
ncbi:MAG: hypothetical protein FJZ94_08365 [Chloroflexi bacterium]|nr:hypothetical protein [Chloroflexota bacterium]